MEIKKIWLAPASLFFLMACSSEIPSSAVSGVATDGDGPLALSGKVSFFAGSYTQGGYADGDLAGARFNQWSYGIASDGTDLYVADQNNHVIRKIELSSGSVSTFVGDQSSGGASDGIGAAARFDTPWGITHSGGALYVVDYMNHAIRKIAISTREVTTIAGSLGVPGSDDGVGSLARFNAPSDIVSAGSNLFVADYGNHTVRKIDGETLAVTTLAGAATQQGDVDGVGASVRINQPPSIASDGTYVFVGQDNNTAIRRITIATGEVTTIYGSPSQTGYTYGLLVDGPNLYISESSKCIITKLVISTGVSSLVAGRSGDCTHRDGTGSAAGFYYPSALAKIGSRLFVLDSGAVRVIE